MNRLLRVLVCAGLGWGLAAGPGAAAPAPSPVRPNPRLLNAELLRRGRTVYLQHCVGCHGEQGDGKGPGAYGLFPKPRDFTAALFKFRSTPSGTLPTDEDLVRTVQQGVLGTSMPPFDLMPSRDVLAVVQHVKTFSPEWLNPEKHAPPMPIPPMPGWFASEPERLGRAVKGKEAFTVGCAPCHGDNGNGGGPAAAALVDSWEQPISPADLRRPYIRSGRSLTDVYKVLVTGVTGAPMPSYLDSTTEDERWELVAYVEQLRRDGLGGRREESTPVSPAAPAPAPAAKPSTPASASPYE